MGTKKIGKVMARETKKNKFKKRSKGSIWGTKELIRLPVAKPSFPKVPEGTSFRAEQVRFF